MGSSEKFVAEGSADPGPKEAFFVCLDGKHLGTLLRKHFGVEASYTPLGRLCIMLERVDGPAAPGEPATETWPVTPPKLGQPSAVSAPTTEAQSGVGPGIAHCISSRSTATHSGTSSPVGGVATRYGGRLTATSSPIQTSPARARNSRATSPRSRPARTPNFSISLRSTR